MRCYTWICHCLFNWNCYFGENNYRFILVLTQTMQHFLQRWYTPKANHWYFYPFSKDVFRLLLCKEIKYLDKILQKRIRSMIQRCTKNKVKRQRTYFRDIAMLFGICRYFLQLNFTKRGPTVPNMSPKIPPNVLNIIWKTEDNTFSRICALFYYI